MGVNVSRADRQDDHRPGFVFFESILQASLGKMNLVTREEFDAQVQVLARTRAKLEALAAELDQLEHKHSDKPHPKKTDH